MAEGTGLTREQRRVEQAPVLGKGRGNRGLESQGGTLEGGAQRPLGAKRTGEAWLLAPPVPGEAPCPDSERVEKVGLVPLSRSLYFHPNSIRNQTNT